jgi:hypothetical protein
MTALLVIAVVILLGILVASMNERAELAEKADAYDRLQQMDALRRQTRSAYQDVVSAHAKESKRIVKEARK